jgi:16S rRNA (cytidine1402-2'-O)-methyltransferase
MSDGFQRGTLYLVSTPIGNLEDITLRAIRILKEADIIAAEDTRRTGILLKHFSIKNRLVSYHSYNKDKKTDPLIDQLMGGSAIALVSDAGTPGISDPAYRLVQKAIQSSIPVVSVPGASAVMAGITPSGLPVDRFVFEGFIPVKKGRQRRLQELACEPRTIVLYEAPHRLLRTLSDLHETLGDRRVAICRELTKKFEEIQRGSLLDMITVYSNKKIQGEFVLIIKGNEKKHD